MKEIRVSRSVILSLCVSLIIDGAGFCFQVSHSVRDPASQNVSLAAGVIESN